jgi:hypothetical protein
VAAPLEFDLAHFCHLARSLDRSEGHRALVSNRDICNEGAQNCGPKKAALLHEIIEALTALGNYLAVAHRKFEEQTDPQQDLGAALKKSLGQQERAREAVRRLSDMFRREAARNDDPEGFR